MGKKDRKALKQLARATAAAAVARTFALSPAPASVEEHEPPPSIMPPADAMPVESPAPNPLPPASAQATPDHPPSHAPTSPFALIAPSAVLAIAVVLSVLWYFGFSAGEESPGQRASQVPAEKQVGQPVEPVASSAGSAKMDIEPVNVPPSPEQAASSINPARVVTTSVKPDPAPRYRPLSENEPDEPAAVEPAEPVPTSQVPTHAEQPAAPVQQRRWPPQPGGYNYRGYYPSAPSYRYAPYPYWNPYQRQAR